MDMPNVGRVLAGNLEAAGITTPGQLMAVGAKEAFDRIRECVDPDACLHMLYGLQGAVEGIPDTQLSVAMKDDLRRHFHAR